MMSVFYSIIGFLIAIAILVAVHEFGHFWVARKLGIKVLRFSIGFGKPLWVRQGKVDNTEFVVAAIPLGGYVKMLDENEGDVAQQERHRAFNRQPIWKRSLVVAAGPGINFLFAIAIFWALGMMTVDTIRPVLGDVHEQSLAHKAGVRSGDQLVSLDGRAYDYFGQHDLYIFNQVLKKQDLNFEIANSNGQKRQVMIPVGDVSVRKLSPAFLARTIGLAPVFPEATTTLSQVVKKSPAHNAGLQAGDTIVAIDGVELTSWRQLVSIVSAAPDQILDISFERDQVVSNVNITAASVERDGQRIGRLGIAPTLLDYPEALQSKVQRPVFQAMHYGIEQTWLMSSVTLRMLWKMLTLEASHENISGPITIAEVSGKAIQIGLDYYLNILAIISISLGVMNLLPIPMLDGGHLVMYAIEAVAGKSSAEKYFELTQKLGLFLLLCLMSLAFYNDIFRLLN